MKIKYDDIILQEYKAIDIVEDILVPMIKEINNNSDYLSYSTLISASLNLIFSGRAHFEYVFDFEGFVFTLNGFDKSLTEHYLIGFRNYVKPNEKLILSHRNEHFTIYLLYR